MNASATPQPTITPFVSGQEDPVAALHNAAFAEWMQNLPPHYAYKPITGTQVATWARPPSRFLVAHIGEEPAGYFCYTPKSRDDQPPFVHLSPETTHDDWGQACLGVAPPFRRRGVATRLLKAALADLRPGDAATVHTYSFNNAATALLKKLGFAQEERTMHRGHLLGFDAVFARFDLDQPLPPAHSVTGLDIRPVAEKDFPHLQELVGRSSPFVFGPAPTNEQIRWWLDNPASQQILVGEMDGRAVAAAEFFRSGVIGVPGVLPTYRRRGIGAALLHALLARMQQAGYPLAVGDTGIIQEEMIALYRRFNFDLSHKLLNWVKNP